ncbi:hypothetical protein GcC1_199005 [Golovinomyces cichoracearum]|uniref:Uncharacterized protein n=1 Tax=Golovinomyces cichoracearum TaxID=62708 RepID=A0A420HF03_9PEZI|nr:hypothetical protein GcC1_199005 [Golovinomyces cichoracearum]
MLLAITFLILYRLILDLKRPCEPTSSLFIGKIGKTIQLRNIVNGTGNDSLYGKNDLYETIDNMQPSTTEVVLPSFPPLLLVVVAATEDPGLAVAGGHELCSAAIATARAALALGGG